MHVVIFCHSVRSDWNNGNAHFLRGIASELIHRGHRVQIFEPAEGWSARRMAQEHGAASLHGYLEAYPHLEVHTYDEARLDLEQVLTDADLVLVHEWNPPTLVERIGKQRQRRSAYLLLFHDTHHRALTRTAEIERLALDGYDGVLAFGEALSERYRNAGWSRRVWTWHEGADTRLFYPRTPPAEREDIVWVGNWGDDERTEELQTFLLRPSRTLHLTGHVYGVRYPESGLEALSRAGLAFGGYLPNYRVPAAFAAHRATVHVPRRPYVSHLPGIPTIRVFEALACATPLVSAPWDDAEGLFRPGDYLVARTETEMTGHLRAICEDHSMASELAARGQAQVLARHTCGHRVDELLGIARHLREDVASGARMVEAPEKAS